MPVAPTGFRRLTPSLLKADRAAESFAGLPDGVTMHGQLLAAFKAAAPRLGLSPRLVHAIDWLFRFTLPQDWGRGGRPIVWPSASLQQEALGLSATRVKAINRALIEAGLITMKDSPNGKRYGKRDRQRAASSKPTASICRRSPRATPSSCGWPRRRRAERAEMGRLRRRATIARNGITQILETAAEYGFRARNGRTWPARPATSPGAQEGRAARGDGAWRREPGAAAAFGAGTPGNAACQQVSAEPRESVNSDPMGAGKPAPPIYLQIKSLS